MEMEEILKRAQERRPHERDEMEQELIYRGGHVGLPVGMVLSVVLMVLKMAAGEPWCDSYAVIAAIMAEQGFYRFARLRGRKALLYAVIWAVCAALLLTAYIPHIF